MCDVKQLLEGSARLEDVHLREDVGVADIHIALCSMQRFQLRFEVIWVESVLWPSVFCDQVDIVFPVRPWHVPSFLVAALAGPKQVSVRDMGSIMSRAIPEAVSVVAFVDSLAVGEAEIEDRLSELRWQEGEERGLRLLVVRFESEREWLESWSHPDSVYNIIMGNREKNIRIVVRFMAWQVVSMR